MNQIFKIFLFLLILAPLSVFAAVQLEERYPTLSDNLQLRENVIVKNAIPKTFKYFASLAIIVSIIIVIISLIKAGVLYLTSSGRVGQMRQAKERFLGSLLGLAILVSSYFILATINPQLTLFVIEKVPARTGIFLFTEEGYKTFTTEGEARIQELIDARQAYILNHDLEDLTKVFGNLVGNNKEFNFENFRVHSLGFWGLLEQDAKVIFYQETNYQGVFNSYTSQEKTGTDGKIDTKVSPEEFYGMKIFKIDPDGFFKSNGDDLKPPLSLKIVRTKPGVYLYAESGEERYLNFGIPDFSRRDFNFNEMAKKIKIMNEKKIETSQGGRILESHDYLAIAHQNDFFQGSLKIFFTRKIWDKNNPNQVKYKNRILEKIVPVYCGGETTGCEIGYRNVFIKQDDKDKEVWKSNIGNHSFNLKNDNVFYSSGFGYYNKYPAGNLLPEGLSEINTKSLIQDHYGRIKSVSSMSVFELSENLQACKKVKLCTEKGSQGFCISYLEKEGLEKTIDKPEINTVKYPLPLFSPVNIHEKLFGVPVKIEGGQVERRDVPRFVGAFYEDIKSLEIEGNCLVVLVDEPIYSFLYKNIISSLGDQLDKELAKEDNNQNAPDVLWPNWSENASRAEIFTQTDADLTDNEIGMCGSLPLLGRWLKKTCARSIVVFPIQATY